MMMIMKAFVSIFQEKQHGKTETKMGYYKNLQVRQQEGPQLIKFSDDFWKLLEKLSHTLYNVGRDVVWDLYSLDSNPSIKNPHNIQEVDVSRTGKLL
jgi:hypothetical protein